MLSSDVMAPRDIRHGRAIRRRFHYDPQLLGIRPSPTSLYPRQNLLPHEALR
jgi:hypothetical protein